MNVLRGIPRWVGVAALAAACVSLGGCATSTSAGRTHSGRFTQRGRVRVGNNIPQVRPAVVPGLTHEAAVAEVARLTYWKPETITLTASQLVHVYESDGESKSNTYDLNKVFSRPPLYIFGGEVKVTEEKADTGRRMASLVWLDLMENSVNVGGLPRELLIMMSGISAQGVGKSEALASVRRLADVLYTAHCNALAVSTPAPVQNAGGSSDADSITDRLRRLKQLCADGVITQQEYEKKRRAILDEL